MQWLSRVPGCKLKGAFPPSFVYAKFTTLMTTTTAAHLWLALDLIKAVGVVDHHATATRGQISLGQNTTRRRTGTRILYNNSRPNTAQRSFILIYIHSCRDGAVEIYVEDILEIHTYIYIYTACV